MSHSLHFDGFYYSGPTPWEDWHAGVRMHGIRFHYVRYYPSGDWLACYRERQFDFWEFTESVSQAVLADAKRGAARTIADADPLCTAGSYTIMGNFLTAIFAPERAGGMKWESQYRILEDRLVVADLDGSDRALLFQPKPLRR